MILTPSSDQGQTVSVGQGQFRYEVHEHWEQLTLGTSGRAADTGAVGHDFRTIRRIGPPFNLPTNLALAPGGELYVADGYGNARIHKFSADGRLLFSWGEPGSGRGQFHLPHGIAVGREGTVYVADRENSRIQLFSPAGDFLAEW